jgi:hypothetical protein
VVIDDRNLERVAVLPAETDPPLIVDPNTVLPETIAFEFLQAIARRNAEIFERLSSIDRYELSKHRALEFSRETSDGLACEEAASIPVPEALDHNE